MDEDGDDFYPVIFRGPCTCDHEMEEHGWVGCKVGCDCDGNWED